MLSLEERLARKKDEIDSLGQQIRQAAGPGHDAAYANVAMDRGRRHRHASTGTMHRRDGDRDADSVVSRTGRDHGDGGGRHDLKRLRRATRDGQSLTDTRSTSTC